MKIHLTRTIFAPSLTKSLAAGQTDAVLALGPGELNDRSARRFHKILNADEYLTWDGENTIISNGCTVPGFAFWAGVQATQLAGFTHRHRILALVRPDGCCAYAIPVPKLEGTFNLPDIELTAGELDSYLRIANSITPAPAEYTVQCPHPARTAVKSNRTEWRSNELNPEALGQLLQQHANWLFPVITAALDVQLRSFAPCAEVPIFLYNFTAKKPNLQVDQAITHAFTRPKAQPAIPLHPKSPCLTAVISRTGLAAATVWYFYEPRPERRSSLYSMHLMNANGRRASAVYCRGDCRRCRLSAAEPYLTAVTRSISSFRHLSIH